MLHNDSRIEHGVGSGVIRASCGFVAKISASALQFSNRYSLRIEIAVTCRKQTCGTNSNGYTKDLPAIRFRFGTNSDGKSVVWRCAEGYDVRASGANRGIPFELQ